MQRKYLTKIERLDGSYPGLADQLRTWFAEGVSARKISPMVQSQFALSVDYQVVQRFRSKRWVRERELKEAIAARTEAATPVEHEQQMRALLAASFALPACQQRTPSK